MEDTYLRDLIRTIAISALIFVGWHVFYEGPKREEAQKIAAEP